MSNSQIPALQPSVWLNTEFNTAWFKENSVHSQLEWSAPLFTYADTIFLSLNFSTSVYQQFEHYSYD